jgi:hypothetical protein
MSKLQEKPSDLKGAQPALQKMKFINWFLFFWDHFCPLGSGLPIRIQGPHFIRIRIQNAGFPRLKDSVASLK